MKLILTKNDKMDEKYKIKEDLNTKFNFENMFNSNYEIYDKAFTNYEYRIEDKKIILFFDGSCYDIKLKCDLTPKNFFLIHELLVSLVTIDEIVLFATVTETAEDNTYNLDKVDILHTYTQVNSTNSIYGFKNNTFNDSIVLNLHKFGRSYNSINFDINGSENYNYENFAYDIEKLNSLMMDIVKEFKNTNFYKNLEANKNLKYNDYFTNFNLLPPVEVLNRAIHFYKDKSEILEDINIFLTLKSKYMDILAEFNIYDAIGNILTTISRSNEAREEIDSNILVLLFEGLLVRNNLIPGSKPIEDITCILKDLVVSFESNDGKGILPAYDVLDNRRGVFSNKSEITNGYGIMGIK